MSASFALHENENGRKFSGLQQNPSRRLVAERARNCEPATAMNRALSLYMEVVRSSAAGAATLNLLCDCVRYATASYHSDGRMLGGASVGGEAMVEDDPAPGTLTTLPGVVAGSEHLSALREGYLRLLAQETGLGYLRLQEADGLARALTAPALSHPVPARADLRWWLAALALAALLARHLPRVWRRGVA